MTETSKPIVHTAPGAAPDAPATITPGMTVSELFDLLNAEAHTRNAAETARREAAAQAMAEEGEAGKTA